MTDHFKMKIAVASGKGGTGKTLVSTNLFWTAQNAGLPVTLVDCDAEEPNVAEFVSGEVYYTNTVIQNIPVINPELCVFCGKCFNYCNYNAIVYLPANHFIQVVEDLCHDCGACLVACNFDAITEKEKPLGSVKSMYLNSHAEIIEACADVGVYSPVPVIKKAIKEAANSYLSIFDSPPGISCPFIATVENADYVILVTEPTPFGLNDLKLSVETLQHLKKSFGVIVNRAGLGNRDVYDWLQKNKIPLLLEIPFDREIARIYSEGRLLAEEKPAYQLQFKQVLKAIEKLVKR
jgi:MinD superfamily P-loop ATPase